MHDTQVSQQVMKHNFLTTVICACGPDAPSQTQSAWFPVSADVDPEVCEDMWDQVEKYNAHFYEKRVSGLFSSFLANEKPVLLCMIMHPASRSFSHQDVNSNFKFPSAVWLLLILVAAIVRVPDSAAIRCIFPISHGHSVEFNLSNAWYHCIPSR